MNTNKKVAEPEDIYRVFIEDDAEMTDKRKVEELSEETDTKIENWWASIEVPVRNESCQR
jgi:hypothetical protein